MAGRRQRRIEVDLTAGILGSMLLALTLAWPDWIEATFGIDPDAGNGAVELVLAGTFLAVALAAGRRAVRELRTS